MPEPNPGVPSDGDIREQLALERGRREGLERGIYTARAQMPPPQPPPPANVPDPFDELSSELATTPAEKAKELLDRGTRMRAQHEVRRAAQALDNRNAQRFDDLRWENAFNATMVGNRDIAGDPEGFAAASAAAEFDMSSKGEDTTNPGLFYGRAVEKYRKTHAKPTPSPDFVEGSGAANLTRTPTDLSRAGAETQANPLAEEYGWDTSEIVPTRGPEGRATTEALTKGYVTYRTEQIEKEGFTSRLPQKMEAGLKKRREEAKKAAASAAGG